MSTLSYIVALVVIILLALTGASNAQNRTARTLDYLSSVPEVTGDSIFGFTDPTDVGDPGDLALTTEVDLARGRRGSFYSAGITKSELGYTLNRNTWIAGSFFSTALRAQPSSDASYISRASPLGVSFEIVHRIVDRSASNPFAVSLSVEPLFYRVDTGTGLTVQGIQPELKLFVDAPIVPDLLYWAGNINWTPSWQRGADGRVARSSGLNFSSAFAVEAVPNFAYVGVETRYNISSGSISGTPQGSALFLGPTFALHITPKSTLSGVWVHQVAGHARGDRRSFDLTDFPRNLFQVKYSVEF